MGVDPDDRWVVVGSPGAATLTLLGGVLEATVRLCSRGGTPA
jgi:hypothetical protein